ncbi:MAG: sensor histidine kinase [Bacteroidota bacterium]
MNDSLIVCEALKRQILDINNEQKDYKTLEKLNNRYKGYAKFDNFEEDYAKLLYIRFLSAKFQSPYISEFLEGATQAKKNKNYIVLAYYYKLLGLKFEKYANSLNTFGSKENNYKKGINYSIKSLEIYSEHSHYNFARSKKTGIYINIGVNYFFQKKPYLAQLYLFKANLSLAETKNDTYNKILFHLWSGANYSLLGQYDSASKHLAKVIELRKDENKKNTSLNVARINAIYDTNEKQIEVNRNRNIAIVLGCSLMVGLIIFFLIQKSTKRKQKLAEQEKALESQKLATVLKEQELVTIDAMIAGQEKERQRIANDLHDDLGGLMATVKLHFNALKDKESPELYEKTNTLIEEAYQKVRSVAHAKNSGVIAKQGLLKAIKHMADKVSASNQLNIEVLDHGLDQRLENSLELTLFRIIQELITNVVKHAEASEATIHLTNHEDSINIMVEDNGKGFNPSQITKTKKGMGISSIDKRAEHLDGQLTIESERNKGTTVIIDIPI